MTKHTKEKLRISLAASPLKLQKCFQKHNGVKIGRLSILRRMDFWASASNKQKSRTCGQTARRFLKRKREKKYLEKLQAIMFPVWGSGDLVLVSLDKNTNALFSMYRSTEARHIGCFLYMSGLRFIWA